MCILNLTLSKYTIAIVLVLIIGGGLGYGVGYLSFHTTPVNPPPPIFIRDTISVPVIHHVPVPVLRHDTTWVIKPDSTIDEYYTAYMEDIAFEDTVLVTYLSPVPLDTLNDYFSITWRMKSEIRDTVKLTRIQYIDMECSDQFKTITYSLGAGIIVGSILMFLMMK